ncbi:MAG TPA: iron ABC transporter permease [Streptosporangiaceae bacterium]|nr:iron ABC transporter permease [Streptosporangiaceae bacterium]
MTAATRGHGQDGGPPAGAPVRQRRGRSEGVTLRDASAGPARRGPARRGPARLAAVTGLGETGTVASDTSDAGAVLVRRIRPARAIAIATALLIVAVLLGIAIGPAGLSVPQVLDTLAVRLPWHPHLAVSALDTAIVWQIRLPRVMLGLLVGSMLAGGGAAYQGVFRNPLADPYLLGVAAGAGLGATVVIVSGASTALTPPAAFAGAVVAVALTYALGATAGRRGQTPAARSGAGSILLAGIAVAAMLTALQTYLQEQHTQVLANVYAWILGGLSAATWSDVWLILPYVAVSAVALLVHRRLLDVLRVGEDEAATLGVNVARVRLAVVMAATLGVAAAVAVSGLIGFVGIIVPHVVRLTAGPSYRVLLPVSMIGGAAFLVLADVVARTAQAPAEVPIGVITALIGGPFFLFVLSSRRARQDL